jgi:hypothetical protein
MKSLGKYSRSVSIIGVGCTPFMYTVDNPETNGLTEGEMFGYAALKAMEDAGVNPQDVDFYFHGSASTLNGSNYLTPNVQIANWFGMKGKGSIHHSEACCTGYLAIEQAVNAKQFTIVPKVPKKTDISTVDYDKLIAVEERRLQRAKEAYLAEIDSIEQYGQNKKEITERIANLKERRDKETPVEVDIDSYTKKVIGIVEFIKRDDVTAEAKNEALHTIIEKIVFEKAKGNLAIYFHDF